MLRRLAVLAAGAVVTLAGVVMLFTPGPAVVVIPLGLAILAREFVWAQRLLERFRQVAARRAREARGWWRRRGGAD